MVLSQLNVNHNTVNCWSYCCDFPITPIDCHVLCQSAGASDVISGLVMWRPTDRGHSRVFNRLKCIYRASMDRAGLLSRLSVGALSYSSRPAAVGTRAYLFRLFAGCRRRSIEQRGWSSVIHSRWELSAGTTSQQMLPRQRLAATDCAAERTNGLRDGCALRWADGRMGRRHQSESRKQAPTDRAAQLSAVQLSVASCYVSPSVRHLRRRRRRLNRLPW